MTREFISMILYLHGSHGMFLQWRMERAYCWLLAGHARLGCYLSRYQTSEGKLKHTSFTSSIARSVSARWNAAHRARFVWSTPAATLGYAMDPIIEHNLIPKSIKMPNKRSIPLYSLRPAGKFQPFSHIVYIHILLCIIFSVDFFSKPTRKKTKKHESPTAKIPNMHSNLWPLYVSLFPSFPHDES